MTPHQCGHSPTYATDDGMSLSPSGTGPHGGAPGPLVSGDTTEPTAAWDRSIAGPTAPVQRNLQHSTAGRGGSAVSRSWSLSSGLPLLPRTTRLLSGALPQPAAPFETPFAWIPGSILSGLFETADAPFPSGSALRRYLENCLAFTARNGGLLEAWGPGDREPAAYLLHSGFGDRRTTHTLFIVLERNHGRRDQEPASRYVTKYAGQDQLVWSSHLLQRIGTAPLAECDLPRSPQALLRALAVGQDAELRNWVFDPSARLPNELSTTLHALSRSSERLGLGRLSTATLKQMIEWSLWRCRCTPSLAVPQWCPRFNSVQLLLPLYQPDGAAVDANLPAEAGDEDRAVGALVLQQEGHMYRVATILQLEAAVGNARLAMPVPPRWLRGDAGAAAYHTSVAHRARGSRAGSSDSEDLASSCAPAAQAVGPPQEPTPTHDTPPPPLPPAFNAADSTPPRLRSAAAGTVHSVASVGPRLRCVAANPGHAPLSSAQSIWAASAQPQAQAPPSQPGGSVWNALMLPSTDLPSAPVQPAISGAGVAPAAQWGVAAPAAGVPTGPMGFALPPGYHIPTPPAAQACQSGRM